MHRLPEPTPPDAFLRDHQRIDDHEFFTVHSPAFEVECSPRGFEKHLKVVAPLSGTVVLRQYHREIEVPSGSFACLDLGEEFQMSSATGQLFQWRVPQETLTRRHPEMNWRLGRALGDANAGERWVGSLMLGLARELPLMGSHEKRLAINTLLEAMGLLPQIQSDHGERQRVSRAMNDLKRDLRLSTLEATGIAANQGVSRRYLDSLMQKHTGRTLAETIRHERLQGAACDLRLFPERTALQIALSWGFENASHFARVFRKDFGCSPTNYRRATGRETIQRHAGLQEK